MPRLHEKAPEFRLQDQDGKDHALSEARGAYALVYFYPKDDTPGCTKEACAIRDLYGEFERLGVRVYGISADSVESHKAFAEKYELPFRLLSDPAREIISAYGASGEPYNKRISYLIDPEGLVAKIYADVDPTSHGGEILNDLHALQEA